MPISLDFFPRTIVNPETKEKELQKFQDLLGDVNAWISNQPEEFAVHVVGLETLMVTDRNVYAAAISTQFDGNLTHGLFCFVGIRAWCVPVSELHTRTIHVQCLTVDVPPFVAMARSRETSVSYPPLSSSLFPPPSFLFFLKQS
jgi:hypothetical protein